MYSKQLTPAQVPGVWQAVDTSNYASCGVTTDGSLYCWGASYYGELGHGLAWRSRMHVISQVP